MDLKPLVEQATNRDGLIRLLSEGLGWPVNLEFPFYEEPEIGAGVTGGMQVEVHSLVPESRSQDHLIVLAEFQGSYVRRDLRELLASLRREIREKARFPGRTGLGDTIFIVTSGRKESESYEEVRFVLFEERERRLPRIRTFGWRKEFIGRTVLTHNLERMEWRDRAKWEKAWDVEGLTDDFYKAFVDVFDRVLAQTKHPGGEKAARDYVQQLMNRLLFVAFIERMGWLATPEGSTDYLHGQWVRHIALKAQRRTYQSLGVPPISAPSTFNGLLGKLFFDGLDNHWHKEVVDGDEIFPLLGKVPYLNGGLFSQEERLDVPGVEIADEVFDLILGEPNGLFRKFNFTVTESTPLDQEVAVDPEMLGKIFERLIIKEERHSSGTYYTPRPIVEFMVNEALKGYLTERGLPAEKSAMLVDEDRVESEPALRDSGGGEGEGGGGISFRPSELQDTLDWLFEVRAVDPACGSGAYLLMLLQRLFELVDRLEVSRDRRRNPSQKHLYETKLRLLERCVYGVDKSEVAVRIAQLRMWLSLVVENRGEKPEPLPNFDYLIMCGDSLASPIKPTQGVLGYPHKEIQEYTKLKRRYFHPDKEMNEDRPTKKEMKDKRSAIAECFKDALASSKLRSLAQNPFDWEVDFAEVFDPEEATTTVDGRLNLGMEAGRNGQSELASQTVRAPGFDIVLANPPYVTRVEHLSTMGEEYKNALVKEYEVVSSKMADLYIYFFARAFEILAPSGRLAFITSNRWLVTAYGKKLRLLLASHFDLSHLIDFRDLPVFQNVIAYPLISVVAKAPPRAVVTFVSVQSLDPPFPDINELVAREGRVIAASAFGADGLWKLEKPKVSEQFEQMARSGVLLANFVNNEVFLGILSGLNEVKVDRAGRMFGKSDRAPRDARRQGVFVIDGAKRAALVAADPKSAEVIRPLITGKDIDRWLVNPPDRYLIMIHRGINIDEYPAIRDHLSIYRQKLEPQPKDWDRKNKWPGRKPGNYRWCELQNDVHPGWTRSGPKLVCQEIAATQGFAVLPEGYVASNKALVLPIWDNYILGILNSRWAWQFWKARVAQMVGGAVAMQTPLVLSLPIPRASQADRDAIEKRVQRILDLKRCEVEGGAAPLMDPPPEGMLICNQAEYDIPGQIAALEADIDARVEFLYFHHDEAATYDEWRANPV